MAALKYWVWLTTLPGLGERAKLQLLAHFGSPEEIYFAPEGELLLAEGITKLQAALLADKSLDRAEKVLEDCARDGQFLLTMDDAGYPARLRNIYDPPLLLYGKGSLPLFDDEVAVTVVGTRDCTPYGVRAASQLGYELARQGALLVSGMAKGIDGEALKGALRAGGFTAAVLGGGADVVYPAANRRLYEDRHRRHPVGVPARDGAQGRPLPGAEPIAQRAESCHRGGGGPGEKRCAHHRRHGAGAGPRGLCRAGPLRRAQEPGLQRPDTRGRGPGVRGLGRAELLREPLSP